jgi:hypothetical protein
MWDHHLAADQIEPAVVGGAAGPVTGSNQKEITWD